MQCIESKRLRMQKTWKLVDQSDKEVFTCRLLFADGKKEEVNINCKLQLYKNKSSYFRRIAKQESGIGQCPQYGL
jgi:hypothetical protein